MERLRIIGKVVLEMPGFFSLDQITKKTKMHRCEVCHVLAKLCLEGLLKRAASKMREEYQERRGRPYYDIIYRISNKNALIAKIAPRLKEETAQDRMWKVIRYLRVFTRSDLIRTAEVSRENAKWYTKMLHRAGYLKPSKPGGPGVEWRLIKDVGPKRPYVGSQVRSAECGVRN
jgi:predicted transcriptional regulator